MKILLLICILPLHVALSDASAFTQPGDNARYQALIKKTRCPTCQNSDIAESNAPLARQLREQIARQIREGHSDSEITAWLAARYGNFVTYDPPLKTTTFPLWLAPLATMLAAAMWWWRTRLRHPAAHNLSDAEKLELQQWITEAERY